TRLGSVPTGEGEPRCSGRGRRVDRGVREGPARQPLQGLEPDVLGLVPPAARAARRDTEGKRRHAPARQPHRRRSGGADGREDGAGAGGGTVVPPPPPPPPPPPRTSVVPGVLRVAPGL